MIREEETKEEALETLPMTTEEYLGMYTRYLKMGRLLAARDVYPVPDIWPDGTRRLKLKDLDAADRQVFTQYKDLMVYDLEGNYILELCIANTEKVLNKRYDKMTAAFSRMVPVKPSNPVGRNEPCPCGSDTKYKKCCLGKVVKPAKTEELPIETPELTMAAQAFADGHISQEELYWYAGFTPNADGEFVAKEPHEALQ